MTNVNDSDPTSRWLERFFDAYPDGDLADLDAWAQQIPELRQDTDQLDRLRATLRDWLGSTRRELQEQYHEQAQFEPIAQRLRELRPGDSVGAYLLIERIGSGGFGEVWKVQDTHLGHYVALKLVLPESLDPSTLARFAIEAKAGARSQHPNLVTTLAYGEDDGIAWIAQELVAGSRTLRTELYERQTRIVSPAAHYRWVANQVARIADGMQAAHDRGVIHRDLKPSNILLDERGHPKVTDFGLARLEDDDLRTRTEGTSGTPQYMSPEQLTLRPKRRPQGGRQLDSRTDVYSLGVVLYELLTLRLPFVGDWVSLLDQILHEDPVPPDRVRPGCPRDLAVICGKAMEKAPDRRYATMAEFAADLRRFLTNNPVLARPSGPIVRGLKWVRRHPAISSAGTIAGMALVVVSLLSLNLARQTRVARDNEELAKLRAEENARLARVATKRANDVLSLSATKDLEDLVSEAEALWPPHPEMLPRYEQWLAEAQLLVDGRPENETAGIKARPSLADHEAKLAELMARSVPQTDESMLAQAREHELYSDLQRARFELTWRKRMLGQEEWPDRAQAKASVEQEELPTIAAQLLALARSLVGPDAVDLGQVTRGWILAAQSLDADLSDEDFPRAMMTMAWAEARLGDADAALASMEVALAEQEAMSTISEQGNPSSSDSRALLDDAQALTAFLASWEEPQRDEREAELQGVVDRVRALEIDVGVRVFADPEDAWWHRQLWALVRGIRELHHAGTGLAGDTLAEPFGWGVRRRAEFAQEVEERSVTGTGPADLWEEVISEIAVSERYGGMVLTKQLGLLPIGLDPESGLWEFAHLHTGEPAQRGEDGKLVLTEETGLVFVLVPGGMFWMGAQKTDPDGHNYDPLAEPNESPVHQVSLSPYFISKYEMTQGQWKRMTAGNPSAYGPDGVWAPDLTRKTEFPSLLHPVEQVTWSECMELMSRIGLKLPTEAQWEHSCRGGTSSVYWSGNGPSLLDGVANISDQYALNNGAPDWPIHESLDDGNTLHAEVGSYRPNGFGLHDVHGNVYEWCRDGSHPQAYAAPISPRVDPVVPWSEMPYRVSRGGAFTYASSYARSADRSRNTPEVRNYYIGLRPARAIEFR